MDLRDIAAAERHECTRLCLNGDAQPFRGFDTRPGRVIDPRRCAMESSTSKSRPLEIRVATGTSDRQLSSAIWRIWQGKNNDDIYIAVRQIAGAVKCSLHPNRYCYVGFTKQFAELLKAGGRHVPPNRAWTSWERPVTPADGFLFVAEIWLPPAPIYTLSERVPKSMWLIEPPGEGKAVVINIVYSRMPKGSPIIPPNVRELGYTKLGSGDYVAVFARTENFDYRGFVEKRLPEIRANFSRNPQFLVDEKVVLEAQALRMFLVNDPTIDGHLMVLDAAVQWAPTDEAVSS